MTRPVTLFTGQWADLPLETLAKKAKAWGFDGLELACWGDHFDVDKALETDAYVRGAAGAARAPRAAVLRHQHAPRRPGVAETIRSTSGTRASCRRGSGATASPRACASAPPRR